MFDNELGRFRICGQSPGGHTCVTPLNVSIPKGLTYAQVKEYAINYITEEMERYFIDECLSNLGLIKP